MSNLTTFPKQNNLEAGDQADPDAIQFPLPDDLRLVALEYQYWPPEGADDESWSEAFLPLLALVRELDARRRKEAEKGMDPGDCVYSDDNDKTIFGEGPGNRCRVDVIASGADAERWTQQNLFGEKFRGENAFLRHWKILNKLPLRPSDERDGFSPYDFLSD